MNQPCILFDLDGTLADTAKDIVSSLIDTFKLEGVSINPSPALTKAAGKGRVALLETALGENKLDQKEIDRISAQFVDIYSERMYETTALYPGVAEMLAQLKQRNIKWGIVTNKLTDTGTPLLKWLGILDDSICTVFGDTLDESKPSPKPLFYASKKMNTEPHHCVMVGDSSKDIIAGKKAMMTTIAITNTYTPSIAKEWQPDFILSKTSDVFAWLNDRSIGDYD